jgi:hypothetical protein
MIKYITIDEAKDYYYPKPAGMSVKFTDAYTLTPDNDNPEHEYVHYWVERKRFDASLSFNEGYIYILESKGQPGILKVGYTDRTPQARVSEINNGTGVIVPWYIANAFACKSPEYIETLVHQALGTYHVNKEGFNVTVSEAERIIAKVIDENNAGI